MSLADAPGKKGKDGKSIPEPPTLTYSIFSPGFLHLPHRRRSPRPPRRPDNPPALLLAAPRATSRRPRLLHQSQPQTQSPKLPPEVLNPPKISQRHRRLRTQPLRNRIPPQPSQPPTSHRRREYRGDDLASSRERRGVGRLVVFGWKLKSYRERWQWR
jgi:hypothetical protein